MCLCISARAPARPGCSLSMILPAVRLLPPRKRLRSKSKVCGVGNQVIYSTWILHLFRSSQVGVRGKSQADTGVSSGRLVEFGEEIRGPARGPQSVPNLGTPQFGESVAPNGAPAGPNWGPKLPQTISREFPGAPFLTPFISPGIPRELYFV